MLLFVSLLLAPLGVELALGRLEELLDEDGEARIRDTAAGFNNAPAASTGSSSIPAFDFLHMTSVWARLRAGRFSRLATRLSKQYAQWTWVAMVYVVFKA